MAHEETHSGVVAFEPQPSGREAVMLGRVQIGEIWPRLEGRSALACFSLALPECGSRAWVPANDVETARRLVLERINDWLNAANLRPNG